MTFEQYKIRVQAIFPIIFEKTLMYRETGTMDIIDSILTEVIRKALAKFEKIKSAYYVGSTEIVDAISILRCVPSTENSSRIMVWDFMGPKVERKFKISHYFTPERRLILQPEGVSVYVEYVIDPATLTVDDLSEQYISWAVDYANAMLKIKEGYLGTSAVLTVIPIDMNFQQLKDDGVTERDNLNEVLNDMHSGGVLAIKVS